MTTEFRYKALLIVLTLLPFEGIGGFTFAWKGQPLSPLHIEGRYLCDSIGNHVILHGYAQTYSPWFNEQGNGWGWGKNPSACLAYNQGLIQKIDAAGWKCNWLRLHMDPFWSNKDGVSTTGESDISAFDETLFRKYLDEVFVPMAEYANSYGLYVVMRPPGVCPEKIGVGDSYHQYLRKVWQIVCSHSKLKNNPYIMFELANEPINMNDGSGNYTSYTDGSQKKCTEFFQTIVDDIRALGCNNILWIPGLSYQMNYQGYVKYPIVDTPSPSTGGSWGSGYAVHCYPGWYGSDAEVASSEQKVETNGAGYVEFRDGWEASIAGVAAKSPILVTEMDWAPKKYNASWGKATTGTEGGVGFGANFRFIMDKTGNVSWLLFTGAELMAKYDDTAADGETFLTDPEACPRPCYRWFKQYAENPDYSSYSEEREKDILDSIAEEKASKKYQLDEADELSGGADNLNGKLLIASDTERQAILYVNTSLSSPQNVRTGNLDDATENPMCFFKFTKVTDATCSTTGNLYTIQMADQTGKTYSLWGTNGYLNSTTSGSLLFALGLTKGYGQDAANYGLWKVDYETGYGYTIQNVGAKEASVNSWLNIASDHPVSAKTYIRMFSKLSTKQTAIEEVSAPDPEHSSSNKIYLLSGQCIKSAASGTIVICNGRKYIVR